MSAFGWAVLAIFGWMLVAVMLAIQMHLSKEVTRLTAASVDTRPEGGDSTQIEAPFTSGAVLRQQQTPK